MAKKTITVEQVEKYNQMIEAAIGTDAYDKLALPFEYKDDDTKRWIGNPYGYLYQIHTFDGNINKEEGDEFYIKTVCGTPYLYLNLEGEPTDRYSLEKSEIARLFFGI